MSYIPNTASTKIMRYNVSQNTSNKRDLFQRGRSLVTRGRLRPVKTDSRRTKLSICQSIFDYDSIHKTMS
ncbi:hypothetical protein GJ744_011346 [Endocarpon pusillum]|uniref:Uncharacterized protein n=1 Tax=Endocarpon pusillum TaxID=364733 RepID=A0A8H7AXS6_9EURO|nr:hypothetical protein GJ744_011346 [Endocarpon pusillum]